MDVELGTRDRILAAAAEILRADDGSTLSVRAIATRAGVGVGTLRHHFPTQRGLLDAAFAHVYEEALPDDRILDRSAPPRDRLRDSLRQLLNPVGVEAQAREFWAGLFDGFISPAVSSDARDAYPAMERHARMRVESWLAVLVEEGSLAPGDNTRRARFLLTVVNGLAVERALPSDVPTLQAESAVLSTALDALPFLDGPGARTP